MITKPRYVEDTRLDAQQNLYFQRELENVASKSYDVKYAELKAAQLVPMKTDIDPGADVHVWYSYDAVGVAKLITAYGDDSPRVDLAKTQTVARLKSYGDSFGWNIDEIKAAAKAGLPLEQRKANMARRALDEKIDVVAFTGDSEAGFVGLANQPNASTYVIPNGATGGSPLWSTKTADEILNDMNGIVNSVVTSTNEIEKPDTLLLPLSSFTYVNQKRADTLNSKTILQVFLQNNTYIRTVETSVRLETAGSGATRRMIAYVRDPDHLELLMPILFEQLPPQPRNYETIVNCRNKTGGVVAYYPLAMAYGDGI